MILEPVTVTAHDGTTGDFVVTAGGALAIQVQAPDGPPVDLTLTEAQTASLLGDVATRRQAAA